VRREERDGFLNGEVGKGNVEFLCADGKGARKLGGCWMEEKNKLSAIADYLKELLPGCVIENTWNVKSSTHMFLVNAPTGEIKHTIAVSNQFVSDNELEDIVTCLKLYNLKGYLEIFGNKEVFVTDDGINPEGIRPSVLA
jgi:hypothetical protein